MLSLSQDLTSKHVGEIVPYINTYEQATFGVSTFFNYVFSLKYIYCLKYVLSCKLCNIPKINARG